MKTYKAEVYINQKYALGEGPYYDSRFRRLSWVNIPEGKIYTEINGEIDSIKVGSTVGAAIPLKESDGFIAACTDGLYIAEKGNVELCLDMSGSYKDYQRSNDAKCDARGRLWFGSSSNDETLGIGGDLYRYCNGELSKVIPDTQISNGMAWSADGKKFYWADSPENAVFVFDYDMETGTVSNRQILCEIKDGVPDGLCIDSNDNLWIAIWGGHRVENRDGKTGELIGIIEVDATNVTCCCFGGNNMDELFITTSGDNLVGDSEGNVFKCNLGIKGPDINYFTKI